MRLLSLYMDERITHSKGLKSTARRRAKNSVQTPKFYLRPPFDLRCIPDGHGVGWLYLAIVGFLGYLDKSSLSSTKRLTS